MDREMWQPKDKTSNNGGQIRRFYAGKRILLTGCTGFFGTGIVEKLLYTCTDIDKIYLMVRSKQNMTMDERINKYFEDTAFDRLRKTNPNFMKKVQPIYGDLLKENMDISLEDYQLLTKNVDIIIHNAAEVSFVAKVSNILKINVMGTKYMLDLAAKCSRLKAFIYVSTAYSHSYNKRIEEKLYAPPCDLKVVEDMIRSDEATPNGISEQSVRDILGKWVNTYTFSKSIAESLVDDFSRKTSVVCSIYRPSIVVASYEEPIQGWIGNNKGPALLHILIGMGLLHVLPINEDTVIDFVPVDVGVNALLASIWDLMSHKKPTGTHVYNCGSSVWKPVYIQTNYTLFFKVVEKYPFSKMVWYPFVILARNLYSFILLHLLFHLIPAALCDAVLYVIGKETKAFKLAWKVTTFLSPIYYFCTGNWAVEVQNTQDILTYMNPADYKDFFFDFARVGADDVIYRYMHSVRSVLLNEKPEMLPAAKKRYKNLKIAHYTVCTFAVLFIVFFVYKSMCSYC
nr:PREDICTED: putative fatty acyl-CoA reductase CG5065 [Megachile rotundata]